jgi:membrane-associated phospholipid phosphatase
VSLRREILTHLGWIALVALLHPIYILINHWTAGLPATELSLSIDHATPLVPGWILVYALLYPVASLPGAVVRYRPLLIRTALAYALVDGIAFVFFIVMPVHMELRPESVPVDSFFTWGLNFCYALDPPSNCFPSLHVATSFVGALVVNKIAPKAGPWLILTAGLIAVSTMFVKQHYLVDVIAGLALGLGVYAWVIRPCKTSHLPAAQLRLPRWMGWACLGLNGVILLVLYGLYRAGWMP